MTAALAALLLLAAPALHLGSQRAAQADQGLPCAAHAALEGALRELLPGLRVEAGGALAEGDLHVRIARDQGRWLLSLRHPGGAVALQRALALPGRDCALFGRTAALVIDRYLEEVRWSGRPARLQPLPAPPLPAPPLPAPPLPTPEAALPAPPLPDPQALPPAPGPALPLSKSPADPANSGAASSAQATAGAERAGQDPALASARAERALAPAGSKDTDRNAAVAKAAETKPADPVESKPPEPQPAAEAPPLAPGREPYGPEPFHLALLAGPALYWGLASDLRFAVLGGALLRRGPLQLGLSLAGTASSTQPVQTAGGAAQGQTQVRTGLVALSAGLCTGASLLRLCGGPAAGLRLSLGSLSGAQLLRPGSAVLVQAAVGGHGTAGLKLTERLELSLDLSALWMPGSARFDVAGAQPRTLSAFDLTWALRLGWLAF